ncbi:MAG: cytochrome C peroxidase [Acidobacteriia bacterium]|nr:cytochrome C peroxidase [Terriglobia bacterium]
MNTIENAAGRAAIVALAFLIAIAATPARAGRGGDGQTGPAVGPTDHGGVSGGGGNGGGGGNRGGGGEQGGGNQGGGGGKNGGGGRVVGTPTGGTPTGGTPAGGTPTGGTPTGGTPAGGTPTGGTPTGGTPTGGTPTGGTPTGGNENGGGGGGGGGGGTPASLGTVPIPTPPDLTTYVRDQKALVVLGKALFWDMQTGTDGKQACATCHFHAGADHRRTNQINGNGGAFTANYTLGAGDFPFHTQQVAGSAGVPDRSFIDVVPGSAVDDGFSQLDPQYSIEGVGVRRVTGRNAPTVINAVFNVRNFWDGRARDVFTVFTPFGDSDPSANIVMESGGRLTAVKNRIQNSSLASQSVGPPMSPVEMSSAGRTWRKLGKKMLSLAPLANQRVHPGDSVLGPSANAFGTGLQPWITYASLIQQAFLPQYWSSVQLVDGSGANLGLAGAPSNTDQYSQMEYNFALFWGLAIQAYEATLVSSASPFDQFAAGNRNALTAQQAQGLNIFTGKGQCTNCHSGAEFTSASFTALNRQGKVQGLSHGLQTDTGFFRTGVRPIAEDIGIGGKDGFGQPLSIAAAQSLGNAAGVNGAFKVPTVRNTEFTGPYFHNGGAATLDQVVDFYSRGGDFPGDGNLGPGIQPLSLSAGDHAALVEFLKALSDDRVRFERAPFDHPQLCVPDGEQTFTPGVPIPNFTFDGRFLNEALDNMVEIPEVGAAGGPPLQTFAELIGAAAANGPRAHDLSQVCTTQFQ